MLYRWVGRKPLQRTQNVLETSGPARGRGKPIGIETHEIVQGETFEPSAAEIHSFRDLMEPVGASLHVVDAENEHAVAG